MNAFPYAHLQQMALPLAQRIANCSSARLLGCPLKPKQIMQAYRAVKGLSARIACNYTLEAIGPMYALYFQGRRIHDGLYYMYSSFKNLELPDQIEILDYGSGTGAVAMAIAILHNCNCTPFASSKLTIHAYEPSPRMLDEGQQLWQDLGAYLSPNLSDIVDIFWYQDFKSLCERAKGSQKIMCAGYVHSDFRRTKYETHELLSKAREANSGHVVCWSTSDKLPFDKVVDVAKLNKWQWQKVQGSGYHSKFWSSACSTNPCGNKLLEAIKTMPDDGSKSQLLETITQDLSKFEWNCTMPDILNYPIYAFIDR